MILTGFLFMLGVCLFFVVCALIVFAVCRPLLFLKLIGVCVMLALAGLGALIYAVRLL